jgi:hypothetical protein
MTTKTFKSAANTTARSARKRWEAPTIVLERVLEVAAQDGLPPADPNAVPSGFLGPLSTSAGAGGIPCT